MNRTQILLLVALAVLVGGVGYLAMRNRQPPIMPGDRPHQGFLSADQCLTCHGPQGTSPRGRNHPLGEECTRCHGFPQ